MLELEIWVLHPSWSWDKNHGCRCTRLKSKECSDRFSQEQKLKRTVPTSNSRGVYMNYTGSPNSGPTLGSDPESLGSSWNWELNRGASDRAPMTRPVTRRGNCLQVSQSTRGPLGDTQSTSTLEQIPHMSYSQDAILRMDKGFM